MLKATDCNMLGMAFTMVTHTIYEDSIPQFDQSHIYCNNSDAIAQLPFLKLSSPYDTVTQQIISANIGS